MAGRTGHVPNLDPVPRTSRVVAALASLGTMHFGQRPGALFGPKRSSRSAGRSAQMLDPTGKRHAATKYAAPSRKRPRERSSLKFNGSGTVCHGWRAIGLASTWSFQAGSRHRELPSTPSSDRLLGPAFPSRSFRRGRCFSARFARASFFHSTSLCGGAGLCSRGCLYCRRSLC